MDHNDALKTISMIQGIINNVIPVGKDGKPLRLDYQEKLDLIYTRETILEEKIEEALDLIKDDPKLEKEMDEIPRLNYLLECIKSTLDGAFCNFTKPEYKKSIGWDK